MSEKAEKKSEEMHEAGRTRSTKFRFKAGKDGSRDERRAGSDRKGKHRYDERGSDSSGSRRHRRNKRRRGDHGPLKDDPSAYDETHEPNSRSSQYVDPDIAFRESLFDALADDEGASYWEGVYGQPIHVYPKVKEGLEGELEQMDDEEYATYVRNRMWEKSHQHIIEERQRRDEHRRKERLLREKQQTDFDSMIDAALHRGERRKKHKSWDQAWKEYTAKWTLLIERSKEGEASATSVESVPIAIIPWPVQSGKREDVSKMAVQEFFKQHPPEDLPRLLKVERVQWHPDKMQQRLRGQKLSEESSRTVTAVFQIVDDLWTEIRNT